MEPKISDFGMSREIGSENDRAFGTTNCDFGPLKILAPEAIVSRVYSQKTDGKMKDRFCSFDG